MSCYRHADAGVLCVGYDIYWHAVAEEEEEEEDVENVVSISLWK